MTDMVLVLDLGDGRGANVARRVRSEQVYSEVLPASASIEAVREVAPKGVLIAGDGAGEIPSLPGLIEMGVPILAMGTGARLLLKALGGTSAPTAVVNSTAEVTFEPCLLFDGLGESERFFERLDALELPEGARAVATTAEGRVAAFTVDERIFGLQFYAEQNDPDGFLILRNFARGVCKSEPVWNFDRFFEETVQRVQQQAQGSRVILAVSGGVDSVVCAALMHRALGEQLTCVHVDTGLMRKGDLDLTRKSLEPQGVRLKVIDAQERFIERLKGVSGTARKTELVDREIFHVLEEEARATGASALGLGVTYSDELNGAQLADRTPSPDSPFKVLIEPVRRLFKEEVRQVAEQLGLPQELIQRPSFPTAGLAVRMMGPVARERLTLLRDADAIFCEEIQKAGLDKRIRQYFAVLPGVATRNSTGRMAHTVALRAMNGANPFRLSYDLLERVVERVTGEVAGVGRVVYDVTGAPPSPVEWEEE
jgi:GMP synthase (glutamine-hydrolysing)